jgi:hypothetical protein
MASQIAGKNLRLNVLGTSVSKSTGTLTAATVPLFTITGIVMVTSIVGTVTTAVTVANSYKLQNNPTVGATKDLCAALDIGTTDSPVGEILTVVGPTATALVLGSSPVSTVDGIVLPAGQIEHVSAGSDGAILWQLTYVAITDGAAVTAA